MDKDEQVDDLIRAASIFAFMGFENSDESFIFQFYTYSESSGDKSGFDGRRMLNLTRIYNRNHPDKKIGFNFDNSDINDSDDED